MMRAYVIMWGLEKCGDLRQINVNGFWVAKVAIAMIMKRRKGS